MQIGKYTEANATVYHEFGKKAHYYSNVTDSFALELNHGFYLTDHKHKISYRSLPKEFRRNFCDKGWPNVFVMENYLHPSIIAVAKYSGNKQAKNFCAAAPYLKKATDVTIDTVAHAITYRIKRKHADPIFCYEQLINKKGQVYKIASYSYKHQWLKNFLDTPSLQVCQSDINEITSSWRDTDLIRDAFTSRQFLLQVSSRYFWTSKNNYLFPLEITGHHQQPAGIDTIGYYEASTTFNSFAGNYKKALLQRNYLSNKPKNSGEDITQVHIADAKGIIYDSARTHSVVIINEAHTQPLNRRFFSELLDSLYAIGYKHLFVETLEKDDTDLNTRGFPIQISGYYSSEPNFGNALRKALKTGYVLHPYDNQLWGRAREIAQAQVIATFMRKHEGEKILIYCGHGHLYESAADSMMGFFLKTATNIDPFTIEQTRTIEKGDTDYEQDIYRFVTDKYSFTEPQTLTDGKNVWLPQNVRGRSDMLVVLPKTHYDADDNPEWMFSLGATPYRLELNGAKYKDCLLQIYCCNELKSYPYWDLVPISNLVLGARNNVTYYLEKGSYSIYVTDVTRNIIYRDRIDL